MRHQLGLLTINGLAATNQQRFGTHGNFGAQKHNVTLRFDALDDSECDGYDTL